MKAKQNTFRALREKLKGIFSTFDFQLKIFCLKRFVFATMVPIFTIYAVTLGKNS